MTRTRCRLVLFFAGSLLATALLSPPAAADDAAARGLMGQVFDLAKVSFEARMKLSSPGGLVRELNVHHKQMGTVSATYMEITAPFNLKDTRFLEWDREGGPDETYTYLPMLKRSVQVPAWTKQQSFLGSNFYMVDIAIPDMTAFDYTGLGTSEVEGVPCSLVESRPRRPEEEVYSKVIYCVDVEKLVSLRTEFYDEKGALLKVWLAQKLEKVDGTWVPRVQIMTDVQQQTDSRLEIVEIVMPVDPADELFRKAHLDR